jgi:hypothetical protein
MKLSDNLVERLRQADVVCSDCGGKYGRYSVGCSSTWEGQCHVCGETKPVTEVRDWGYLAKGIALARAQANIKDQSKEVADYLLSVGPIMNDDELEDELTPSYEQGEITCKFTEAEVTALLEVIDGLTEEDVCPPGKNEDFDSAFMKIADLYADYCIKYELSPALRAYNEKYGTWGSGSPEEEKRWEGFRDAFVLLHEGK